MKPLNSILVIEIFDCWGIDFICPFLPSFGFFFIDQNVSIFIDQNETALETSKSTIQAYTKNKEQTPWQPKS